MRIIVQRVKSAKVTVEGNIVGQIKKGLLLLVGIHRDDTDPKKDIERFATKCLNMRLWPEIESETAG